MKLPDHKQIAKDILTKHEKTINWDEGNLVQLENSIAKAIQRAVESTAKASETLLNDIGGIKELMNMMSKASDLDKLGEYGRSVMGCNADRRASDELREKINLSGKFTGSEMALSAMEKCCSEPVADEIANIEKAIRFCDINIEESGEIDGDWTALKKKYQATLLLKDRIKRKQPHH